MSAGTHDTDVSGRSPVWKGGHGASRRTSIEMERTQGPGEDFFFFNGFLCLLTLHI